MGLCEDTVTFDHQNRIHPWVQVDICARVKETPSKRDTVFTRMGWIDVMSYESVYCLSFLVCNFNDLVDCQHYLGQEMLPKTVQ